MSDAPVLGRRAWMSGSLLLAFALASPALDAEPARPAAEKSDRKLPRDLSKHPRLDAWLRIGADGRVTLKTGKVELGQGVLTALGQICADELDIDLARLDILSGDTKLCPDQGVTAGSMSMPEGGVAIRMVSAEARAWLLELASQRLHVPASRLEVQDGTVREPAGRQSVTYWELVKDRDLSREATGKATPKPPGARRYAGKSIPRRDLPDKITGAPSFVHDLRPAGMVHGRMVRPPVHGASLVSFESAAADSMPGVIKVVRDGDVLGVLAQREWQAIKAAAALAASARWREPAPMPTDVYAWLLGAKADVQEIARVERPDTRPSQSFEATFQKPYLMHASIGPSCAVAHWDGQLLTVDTHSQSVFETCEAIAKMLGLAHEQVHGRHLSGSGCYGHNGADDAAADAALLAHALPGKPVRVQWSRQDEHTCEPYGPAMVMQVRASVDDRGDVLDWTYDLWSTSHSTRPGGEPGNLLAGRTRAQPAAMPTPKNGGPPNYAADRNAIPIYRFPGQKVTTHFVPAMPLRSSSHRGLGAFANVFAIESFLDELAHAARVDPVDYRLRQLGDERARAVLSRAAERFGWSAPRTPKHGRGVAFARYKNLAAYCAVCLEVTVDRGAVRLLRAVIAADAGEVINPDGLANQLEGGLIQGLSWALREEVQHDAQRIRSRDWASYPILTFSQIPPVEVVLLDRPGDPPLGAGEASQGPAAAALANAIFDATAVRARSLPLQAERR